MELKLLNNIWKSSKSYFGFYCVNIYQVNAVNTTLSILLDLNILNDNHLRDISVRQSENPSISYGPIVLSKLSSKNFKEINYDELKLEISNYWKDENWGSDLLVFKENFEEALKDILPYLPQDRIYYYLNVEKIDVEILENPNFYSYFVTIISTLKDSEEVIVMTFGID